MAVFYKLMRHKLAHATLLLICSVSHAAHAENWQPLTGASALQTLVSGATAEINLKPGVTAVGKYAVDGTAEIEAWGEVFRRTWVVKGDYQVCYSSDMATNCFSFEQNFDDPVEYRSRNIKTGKMVVFRIIDAKATSLAEKNYSDDGGLASPSAAEIAAELSDPNTNLGSMNMQFDYIAYQGGVLGADNAEAWRMQFQPSLPYSLSETTNLFVQPAIPVIFDQDVPDPRGEFNSEGIDLGDISFDAALGKTFPGGFVLIGGLAGTLPTATEKSLGMNQWLLGPEGGFAIVRPWGVVGAIVSHQWDVAGEDDYDTSITGGQYFYAFNLGGGWQLNAAPTFSYNHKADNDNKWTFPLAAGVSKTSIINGRPWKFGLQLWHYIETPDTFGPDYQVRFTVSPVIKLPW